MSLKEKRRVTIYEALIPVVFLVVALYFTLQKFGGDPHIPILASAGVAALVALRTGYTWKELENGVIETIKMSMSAILILMIIGMIIGTWILSGVVPTMIYYGLQILSPGIFLVATTLICAVVSLATGSSWTTAGTVGIALIGIGQGLQIPIEIVAGAIVSGAYFGDKMSPLSDTTNLAPSMAGSDLFDHIRHMIYTTGPSLIISLILFGILGFKYSANNMDTASINVILDGLKGQFSISPLLLIPPILVIGMVILKIPAIPGLIGGTVIGGIFAFIFQGAGMSKIIEAAHYGFKSETGIEAIDGLLSRGGLDSMMWTVSLILCAMAFGGIMEKSGMLNAIAEQILKYAKSTGSIVLSTILTSIAMNLIAGDQYLSIVIPGRMYKDIYDKKGLHPKNLSRVLEDSGTLTSPLVPWNTCGSFMWKTLGVHPFAYLPYAFLNLLNPLVSIFYAYTGITMEKVTDESNKNNKEIA
ncbi:Na+/H+ antiporter NhaC [Paramaledivibacter caminithermalis]|jgi:NhaC family Na+:H+ antiporter|uniref:Na+:H+ antiporter, NhaC family n=1 Tax=Paramaledivibacter caminithermalis (strain DSM 15212 / CIP 107654 / DViRD3) TaxID=1121301 RepID=A0A1M6S5Y0_PARC5|nr:Na+/H+ antiporter NhaC [Paramaledivibacter caminithermalis]SHK39948.1 Na+:H+ antiporter, NhaC family [Paramaledivibacter caminithermalis DSM 15212]